MAVGLPLKTTYANGDVYSASDVNDTNGTVNLFTSSTLSYQAGKNAIINGGQDIAQRGTSFTNVNGYTTDRWYVNRNGAVAGCTASQSTDVPTGFQFSLKTQRVAGNTGTQSIDMYYGLESKDSYRFRSQTATLSFYAKVGANYSGGASGLTARILSGTATDAPPYNGSTTVATSSPALTTTWTRFTLSGTFGASITQAFVQFGWSPTGTAGADDSVFITGVQLELGSTATTFSRTGGTIQGELAACQRYYIRYNGVGQTPVGVGSANSATQARIQMHLPVNMRTTPSAVETGGSFWLYDGVNIPAVTAISFYSAFDKSTMITCTSSSLTQYRPYFLIAANDTAAYVGLTAELQEMTMDNVTFIEVDMAGGGVTEHAIIDRGNGEFTSMLKSTYDEMIARNEANTL